MGEFQKGQPVLVWGSAQADDNTRVEVVGREGDRAYRVRRDDGDELVIYAGYLRSLADPAPAAVPEPAMAACNHLRNETCDNCAARGNQQGQDRRSEEAKLADDLIELLAPFAGDGGHTEGARECLQRITCELRDRRGECATLRAHVARLERLVDLQRRRGSR